MPRRGHLLEVDQRLHRRRVAAAELGRVAGDHPAVVEQRRLPVARPVGDDRRRRRRRPRRSRARPRLGRRVLVEERDQLGPERLVASGPTPARTRLSPRRAGRRTAGRRRRTSRAAASRPSSTRVDRPGLVGGDLGERAPALEQLDDAALHLHHLAGDAVATGRTPASTRPRRRSRARSGRSPPRRASCSRRPTRLGEAGAGDRRDGVDPHAEALELARQHDRHRRDAGLGRRVVDLTGVAVEARLRRGVDDRAR